MAVSQKVEREQIFQRVVETIGLALKVPACIWLADESGQVLRIVAAAGLPDEYVHDVFLRLDEPCIASVVFATGQSIVVPSIAAEERWKYREQATALGLQSAMVAPLRVKTKIVGVMDIYSPETRVFGDFERTLVESFANQASITQRRIRDLALLNKMSLLISAAIQPAEILARIVQATQQVLDCQHVSVFLAEGNGDLVLHASSSPRIQRKRFAPGEGLVSLVVQQNRSLLVPDVRVYPQFLPGLSSSIQERSMLLVPICLEDAPIGVISADMDGLDGFDEHDQVLVESLASEAAIVLRNADLLAQSQNWASLLQQLHQISNRLFSVGLFSEGLPSLLRQVAQSARSVLHADLVDVYEYYEDENRYVLPPILEGERRDPYIPKEQIFEDDVIVKVVRGGQPVYYANAQGEPAVSGPFTVERPQRPERRFVVREGVRSSAAVPLKAAGETAGVMFVSYRTPQEFSPTQKSAVELFAHQAAGAIYNARVHEQARAQITALAALNEIGQQLSTVEVTPDGLTNVLRQVAEHARQVLGVDLIELYQFTPGRRDVVSTHVSVGERRSGARERQVLPDDVAGRISSRREAVFSVDAQVEPLLASPYEVVPQQQGGQRFVVREGIVSTAAVPLQVGDEVVGVLFANYRTRQGFRPEQRGLIRLFANQAAIAIRNAQMFQQRQTLQDIARDITSLLDRDKLLQTTLEQSLNLLNCEAGSISVFDPQTETLRFRYSVGKAQELSLRLDEGLIGRAARTRRPVRVGDVQGDPDYVGHVSETRSELDVPLLVGDRLIGVLNAESRRLNAFSEADEHLAEALAAQAAVAFYNAELFQRTQEQLEHRQVLNDISQLFLAKHDVRETIRLLMQRTLSLFHVDQGSYWSVDYAQHRLALEFSIDQRGHETDWGQKEKAMRTFVPLEKGSSIIGQTAVSGELSVWNDVTACPYWNPQFDKQTGYQTRRVLSAPLLLGAEMPGRASRRPRKILRPIGVLQLVNPIDDKDFTAEEQEFLMAIASIAAAALHNARTHEREKALAAIGQQLTAGVRLREDEVMELIYEQASQVIDTDNLYIALYDKTTDVVRFGLALVDGNGVERLFSVELDCADELDKGELSARLRERFQEYKQVLTPGARVEVNQAGNKWKIVDADTYFIRREDRTFLFSFGPDFAGELDNRQVSDRLREQLQKKGLALTPKARVKVDQAGSAWTVADEGSNYSIQKTQEEDPALNVYVEDPALNVYSVYVETAERWQPRRGGKGRTEWIIHNRQPILIDTKRASKDWYKQSEHKEYVGAPFASWLGVPLEVGDRVLGVIATYNPQHEHVFTLEDQQILQAMASQAAIALDNAHMFYDINHRRKALVEFGQQITADIHLSEQRILELIHSRTSTLMDTANMYIALYDEDTGTVRFGLAFVDGRTVDVKTEEGWQPRREGKGRTEWIIRNKAPILLGTEKDSRAWYARPGNQEYTGGTIWPSWLGVPMRVGGKILGVIATYHMTREYAYSGDDQEVLQALADQAGIALENARLYEETLALQDKVTAAQQLATLGTAMAALRHRINNTFNIIVPNVSRLRKRLDPRDKTITGVLNIIERNARYTSEIIARIQEPLREIEVTDVDINAVITDVTNRAQEQWSSEPDRPVVRVHLGMDETLPIIRAPIGQIAEVFNNLCGNAFRAMRQGGDFCVESRSMGRWIHVTVQDTGSGIPSEIVNWLFTRPVPPRDPGGSSGLGLWISNLILQSIGGNIRIVETNENGTTILVQIPMPAGRG